MPRVRDRHSLADAGRTQLLTAQDGPDHALHVVRGQPAGLVEAPHHLANRRLLARGLQVHEDGLSYHEIQELHPPLRAGTPADGPLPSAPSSTRRHPDNFATTR